jgi:gas vesicle protein
MEIKKLQHPFECKSCDYVCSRKSSYDKHILTRKHKISILEIKSCTTHSCLKCGKEYKTTSGIWKHERVCKVAPSTSITNVLEVNKELTRLVVKQQEEYKQTQEKLMDHIKEQQKQIQELIPRIGNVINIHVFLQDKCKDAVNWNDFIRSLPIHDSSNIMKTICDGIEELGLYKRPIHCFDTKQLCIKNENVWEHDRIKINDTIVQSNVILKQQWENTHPEWYNNAKDTEQYTQLMTEEINPEKLCGIL